MRLIPCFLAIATTICAISSPTICSAGPKHAALLHTRLSQQLAIQQAVADLNAYAELQGALGIQNADIAYGMRKALVMADLLVNADGTLNTTACPQVKSAFIPSNPEEYEVNMGKVLDQLNSSWQPFFTNVQAPTDRSSVQHLVLRALFSLKANQPVTDRHAKVAVLAAMLAPYNQGPVGDCFAVNDVIRDHQEYYQHAAADYQSIVMNGYLERPVNGKPDYFFFLPILADDDRDQQFTITAQGRFPDTNYSLFDAPGFAAARALMGGDNITGLSGAIMQVLSSTAQGNQIQVTPTQVIAAMAQAIAANTPNTDIDALCALGAYGFSGLTNNTILRGVEAAFAAMAEDRPQDSTRGNVNSCVAQALQNMWKNLQSTHGATTFQLAFTDTFNASYRLLYNLDIPLAQTSADGSSTDGGFQLYQRIPTAPTQLGTRMATPQDFQQLVLDAIDATQAQLGSTRSVQAIASAVTNYANTDDFLKNALWAYDSSNQQEPDPIQNYQKLSRTPMQSCDGDNPFEVDDIDTKVSYDKDVQSYTPSNMKDLITWCLNLAKVAPPELIPMDSPQHAFNFVPANPDITSFLKKKMNPGQWIQNMLMVPGMQVSRQSINSKTQQALANGMYNQISSALPNPQAYQQLVQSLNKKTLSIKDYASGLLSGINRLLGSDGSQASQVALALDALLLQSLPANDLAILSQSAIRFAFTNWDQGTKDIYFCAFFNPRSEQVSFGTIFEDKTNLQPMDETAWINNQQWDVDLKPFAPR